MTQKGKIGLIIAVIAVVVAGGGAAWYFLGGGKVTLETVRGGSATTINPAVDSACKKAGGDDELCRFYAGAHDFTKSSSQLTITTQEGVMKTSYDGNGNVYTEAADGAQYILIDGESYILESGAKEWLKMPAMDSEAQLDGFNMEALQERFKSDEDVEDGAKLEYMRLGEKQLNGQAVTGYKVFEDSSREEGVELWFDAQDNKLYQIQLGVAGSEDATTIDISYQEVKIEKPSPVREYSLR